MSSALGQLCQYHWEAECNRLWWAGQGRLTRPIPWATTPGDMLLSVRQLASLKARRQPPAFPTMNTPSREVGRVVAIGLTVTGMLLLALAQWIWAHRREILDGLARAVRATYDAGRWCRAQVEATSERAAALVDAQPIGAIAPITANLLALRELLEAWVSRLYRQLVAS